MSIIAYKTDAIIITDYKSLIKLINWANSDTVKGLVGKKVIIAESSFGWTAKSPTPNQKATINLLVNLMAQARKLSLDFIFILNNPEYLDPRIKLQIGEVKTLQ